MAFTDLKHTTHPWFIAGSFRDTLSVLQDIFHILNVKAACLFLPPFHVLRGGGKP